MAEDEGFEPPQTESESGVLPLHKSSKLNVVIIRKKTKKSRVYLKKFCTREKAEDAGAVLPFMEKYGKIGKIM